MAKVSQATVSPDGAASPTPDFGKRGQENLNQIFGGSPLPGYQNVDIDEYDEGLVDNICLAAFNGNDINESVPSELGVSKGIVNDGGYMFSKVDLNYGGAPIIADVETGGAGKPGSPYAPNLVSPGDGSVDAADQDEYTGTYTQTKQWGSGLDPTAADNSPDITSAKIAEQKSFPVGDYISGRSYKGSDGE
jgi:hypothetical protein